MSPGATLALLLLCAGCANRALREAEERTVQGDVPFGQGNYTAAIPVYEQVLQQLPNYPRALLQLGICWERLGMTDRAVQAYEGLLTNSADSPEAPRARARRDRLTELKIWDPSKGPKPKDVLD
jgi:tetratricopeptide (TPR) repeat protein